MNLVLDSVLLSMSLLVKKRSIALAQERNFQQALSLYLMSEKIMYELEYPFSCKRSAT
jgi:hypothetical protein